MTLVLAIVLLVFPLLVLVLALVRVLFPVLVPVPRLVLVRVLVPVVALVVVSFPIFGLMRSSVSLGETCVPSRPLWLCALTPFPLHLVGPVWAMKTRQWRSEGPMRKQIQNKYKTNKKQMRKQMPA